MLDEHCSCHNRISALIKDNNSYASLDYDKAVPLNDQFTSVFTNDNCLIPDRTLNQHILYMILFTRKMVRKCLCQLSNSSTIPPGEIPYYILHKLTYDLSLLLYIIFNKSIECVACPIIVVSR